MKYLALINSNNNIMGRTLISFDWAMKKMLRDKANFDILEGFLSELLKIDITIENIIEGESNKDSNDSKYNKVDILAKSTNEELILIEMQHNYEPDYFQRMVYGVSQLITSYIKSGDPYSNIKKAYSINIIYFDLGDGTDYIYEYKGEFIGMHKKDVLLATSIQKQNYKIDAISGIFPKYYILKVNEFDDNPCDTLDEWVYFLKNSEVKEPFKAKGLDKVKEKLQYESLSDQDRAVYRRSIENRRIERSVYEGAIMLGEEEGIEKGRKEGIEKGRKEGIEKGRKEGIEKGRKEGIEKGRKEGIEKGRKEGRKQAVLGLHKNGIPTSIIASSLNITEKEVLHIIHTNKT